MDLILAPVFGEIDFTELTRGLVTAFEAGVESALPVAGVIIAAMLVIRTIRRVIRA